MSELSPLDKKILDLLRARKSQREIARLLDVSPSRIRQHITRIISRSLEEMIRAMADKGVISIEGLPK